jgi:quercetin dioxygenase-like cupin family protein
MNQQNKDYFGRPAGEPAEPGLFLHIADLEPVLELAPGITTRPIVGANLLASFVHYEPNAVAPLHSHVEEQLFMVFEGEIELELSGERRVLRPGDAALIPAWVPHAARAVGGPAYQLDVFSPPRQAMLDMIAKLRG